MYAKIYRALISQSQGEREKRRLERKLESYQELSQSELNANQLKQIQGLIKHAYETVPYYQNRSQRDDIHPDDVKAWTDYEKLPLLTKADINNNLDDLISPMFRQQLQRNATGGSTGEPMRFFVEDSFWLWHAARTRFTRSWHGIEHGAKVAWIWGAIQELPGSSWQAQLKARIKRERYLDAFMFSESGMRTFAKSLARWKPTVIRAYPSALREFSEYVKDYGPAGIRPRLIETTSEKLTTQDRRLFEEVFQCKVADCYASRELAHSAYECDMGGLHVCPTRHLEILKDGIPAEPSETGDIVITSLHQYALPFIRYKTDDLGSFEIEDCSCGRVFPVLREISGRAADLLLSTDGKIIYGAYLDTVFWKRPEVFRYQAYQPDIQHLHLRIAFKSAVQDHWINQLRSELKSRFGESMQISITPVEKFELTRSGKHRYVISDVAPERTSLRTENTSGACSDEDP